MKSGISTTVVIATALFLATTVGANAQMPAAGIDRSNRGVDVPRAMELEREAEALQRSVPSWNDAAARLREAARLRPANDPQALEDLQTAATIYTNTGAHVRSQDTLLELVRRATDFGEVTTAAHALIDAAFAAARRGQHDLAREYFGRARMLSLSSHLTSDEQARLAVRLDPPDR
jgi:hypothetical protein